MENRDYLKDQIDQMSRVLGSILTKLLGLKSFGSISDAINVVDEELNYELSIDFNMLLCSSSEELLTFFKERKYNELVIEDFANIFFQIGNGFEKEQSPYSVRYLQKSLEMLEIADELSKTASMSREEFKTVIKDLLISSV